MNKKKQIKRTFEEAFSRHKSEFENELTRLKCEEGYPPEELEYQIRCDSMLLYGYLVACAELQVVSESDYEKYSVSVEEWLHNMCVEFDITESEGLIND